MPKLLAPIALAAAFAAAALTTSPRPAFALSDPVLSSGDGGSTDCGQGSKVECGSTTVYKCTSWMTQVSFGSTGISVSYVCASSITQTSKSYRD